MLEGVMDDVVEPAADDMLLPKLLAALADPHRRVMVHAGHAGGRARAEQVDLLPPSAHPARGRARHQADPGREGLRPTAQAGRRPPLPRPARLDPQRRHRGPGLTPPHRPPPPAVILARTILVFLSVEPACQRW